jgi:hypothetical protein
MIAFMILLIVVIMILTRTERAPPKDGKKWTVYGTMGCGWTRKQLEYMNKKNIPHTFIDCDEESCAGMDAFPTLVDPSGKQLVGYNEV